MKKLSLIIMFVLAIETIGQAQYWGSFGAYGVWILVTPISREDCAVGYVTYGGVTQGELNDYGLQTVGSGWEGYGYYEFFGQWEMFPPDTVDQPYIVWPPSEITIDMLFHGRNNVWYYNGCSNCLGCSEINPGSLDTTLEIEAFGFWHCNIPDNCGLMPGINDGYIQGVSHPVVCLVNPCPSYFWEPKRYLTISFADSNFKALPDSGNIIISGDSPLYITAHSFDELDSLWAWVILEKYPIVYYDSVKLEKVGTNDWKGKAKSARKLGLVSYTRAAVMSTVGAVNASDEVDVCLPIVVPARDTIIIRTDSMKISLNPSVSLYIIDDSTHNIIPSAEIVADAAYKYKSKWTANANRPADHKTYYRQFPAGTFYKQWDGAAPRCEVTFNRDSLFVVGGSLTYECKGHLKHVDGIDNSFLATTDTTVPPQHIDTLQTKRILVDKDPANSLFLDSLQYDIIKALAWQEYAGSNDTHHCNEHLPDGYHYNKHYNDYWDYFIDSHGDTCYDTRTPCENIGSTATGTMQMQRSSFEKVFLGNISGIPSTYIRCSWDSLAWNWKMNISNGKYVFFPYNKYYMTLTQRTWDSVCVLCDPASMFPKYPNREDLSSYGYNQGVTHMANDITKENWKTKMGEDTPGAIYVRALRLHKYVQPWLLLW